MGSEMCIRDSLKNLPWPGNVRQLENTYRWICLLYTSDAADEEASVELGGRRIIKKKKT